MSLEPQQKVLNLYPLNNQFIGQCSSDDNVVERSTNYETIIILDRSGSMDWQVQRLVKRIFPMLFNILSYKPESLIHLIAFDDQVEFYKITMNQLQQLSISARGGTYMTPAVRKCHEFFQILDSKNPVRLLTISDGIVADQIETAAAAAFMNNCLKTSGKKFLINSKAVRLFTSSSNPDTTAISSLLQINNGPSKSLIDVSSNESDDSIARKIADLFIKDNFDKLRKITASSPIFKQFPWEDQTTSQLPFLPGENVFWMTGLPSDGIEAGGSQFKFEKKPPLNADQFEKLTKPKFESIIEKIKVSKIIDSTESEKISRYFEDTAKLVPAGRKKFTDMEIYKEIRKVTNDPSVTNMNEQEKAEYLRQPVPLLSEPDELPLEEGGNLIDLDPEKTQEETDETKDETRPQLDTPDPFLEFLLATSSSCIRACYFFFKNFLQELKRLINNLSSRVQNKEQIYHILLTSILTTVFITFLDFLKTYW